MSTELWVAIIGAIAVGISAILSAISIFLTNKNSKKLKLFERSNKVKTEISSKRYEVYQNLIDYINSWYDIQPVYEQKYSICPAKNNLIMGIYEHRIKSINDMKVELDKVVDLSLNYFYYDGKTYKLLKGLESYLSTAINYYYNNHIEKENLFFYIIYCDIWSYLFKISKGVNKFIKSNDTLKFRHSKSVNEEDAEKLFHNTYFYNIYYQDILIETCKKIHIVTREKKKELEDKIIELEITLQKETEETEKENTIKAINELREQKETLDKIKTSKKIEKRKLSKGYNMWKKCKECSLECVLATKKSNADEQ